MGFRNGFVVVLFKLTMPVVIVRVPLIFDFSESRVPYNHLITFPLKLMQPRFVTLMFILFFVSGNTYIAWLKILLKSGCELSFEDELRTISKLLLREIFNIN